MIYPLHSRIAERAKRLLNTKEFSTAGSPEEVIPMNLVCPYERQYILRMVVRADGGVFYLPLS